jgi:hypothetical protein
MSVNSEQIEKAFSEFQQFGPRRRIPVEKRWRELLPDVDPHEFPELQARCREIEAFAVRLAEQVRDKQIPAEVAQKQLSEKYPFLTRLGHTWSQAMYFAIK